jgi:hypothetical protein
MVEYLLSTQATRVRFPASASFAPFWSLHPHARSLFLGVDALFQLFPSFRHRHGASVNARMSCVQIERVLRMRTIHFFAIMNGKKRVLHCSTHAEFISPCLERNPCSLPSTGSGKRYQRFEFQIWSEAKTLRLVWTDEIRTSCCVARSHKHWWFSGRMLACHAGDPGPIPGQCMFFYRF